MSRPPADSSPVRAGPGQPAAAAGDPAAPTPAGNADTGARRPTHPAAPAWALRVLATSGALLALVAGGWLLVSALLRVPLLTVTVALALLLAALVQPVARWLRHLRLHRAVAALLTLLLLAGILTCVGLLVGFRAAARLRDLTQPLAAGIDRIRVWLVEGPLGLDP